jgi:hypothetical protein
MEKPMPKMTPELEDVLRNTVITKEDPGSLLHDFEFMLDFVDTVMPTLTKSHLLSLKDLSPLNQNLHRHIEHGLARPVQKSFPHINGLFLLLRASGLTVLDSSGRKPRLTADATALQSWGSLNAGERYFCLLESWLMRGDEGIVGERPGRLEFDAPFYVWVEFYGRLQQNSWYEDDWVERVRYRPGLHNLGLMELFGLVDIEDGAPVDKKGWQIRDVRATRWGQALLAALWPDLGDNWEFWTQLAQPYRVQPGTLQPFIQPYRPDWRRALDLPADDFKSGMYVFKVSLDDDLWRQIIIRDISTLDDLSDAILNAFAFDHDHLYRFVYPTRFGMEAEVVHPYMDETPSAAEVRIGELPAQVGFRMLFNYDFGDNWLFEVSLERIEPPQQDLAPYRIGGRQGDSPEQYPTWE